MAILGARVADRRRGLPLWIMPVAVVIGIYLIFVLAGVVNSLIGGLAGGLIGAVVAVALVVWLERRADAYVRLRAASEDDQLRL